LGSRIIIETRHHLLAATSSPPPSPPPAPPTYTMLQTLIVLPAAFVRPIVPSLVCARRSVITAAEPATGTAFFHRAQDFFSVDESVSAVDIVNVLGRWTTWQEWDGIGELQQMDKLFTADGVEKVRLKSQQTSSLLAPKKGNGDWVKKTPQRRGWCLRNKLVQRYWHGQNVELLPFRSQALAQSVGSSVAEMNRRPISAIATDIVFDALSRSKGGIIQRDLCDERRASYQTATGAFDAEAFRSDLGGAKVVIARSFCIFPGTLYAVQAGLFYKLDGWGQTVAYLQQMARVLGPAYLGIDPASLPF